MNVAASDVGCEEAPRLPSAGFLDRQQRKRTTSRIKFYGRPAHPPALISNAPIVLFEKPGAERIAPAIDRPFRVAV